MMLCLKYCVLLKNLVGIVTLEGKVKLIILINQAYYKFNIRAEILSMNFEEMKQNLDTESISVHFWNICSGRA